MTHPPLHFDRAGKPIDMDQWGRLLENGKPVLPNFGWQGTI